MVFILLSSVILNLYLIGDNISTKKVEEPTYIPSVYDNPYENKIHVEKEK